MAKETKRKNPPIAEQICPSAVSHTGESPPPPRSRAKLINVSTSPEAAKTAETPNNGVARKRQAATAPIATKINRDTVPVCITPTGVGLKPAMSFSLNNRVASACEKDRLANHPVSVDWLQAGDLSANRLADQASRGWSANLLLASSLRDL